MLGRVAATSPEERIDWKISPNLFGISCETPYGVYGRVRGVEALIGIARQPSSWPKAESMASEKQAT
jgi:hypothetical protein